MTRPCSIYVSRGVFDALKAKKELDGSDCIETVAENILWPFLCASPAVMEVMELQAKSRAEYERKLAELVKARK